MNRVIASFPIEDFRLIKLQMLNWANRFSICCFLDNHEYQHSGHSHECLLAAGARYSLRAEAGTAFEQLKDFSARHDDWLFGHLGYDLKNETETLSSTHTDCIKFPDLFFFIPEILIELTTDALYIGIFDTGHREIWGEILCTPPWTGDAKEFIPPVRGKFSKTEYLQTVETLKKHILRGDCYEINLCQEFFAEGVMLDPMSVYASLSRLSPAPFGAYYRLEDKHLLCASPERYLQRKGDLLLSQPIKGTWPRDILNPRLDLENRDKLFHSGKDRSENVMVVDLVRNDLSKVCEADSVRVEELYGIYSFPQVHQMISSVSGRLAGGRDWVDVIKATFPMGSMTGAPKKRVMELIEQFEKSKRGLFSGALGYVDPERNFDFNVVIRSMIYNQTVRYLSYQAGSAITFYSDAEKEYEECLLKAAAIKKVLAG